jgi:TolB-like protein/DNA-binding winged helix-turn-helix (wHTH) protein/Tfp pilus assembly protein PilF
MRVAFGEYQLDSEARTLQREGQRIPVQAKAFDLLVYLIERRERVVSSNELLDALWPGLHVTPAALSTAIQKTRQAVGDDGEHQEVLQTEYGQGFRFVAEVTDLSPPATAGPGAAGAGPMSLVAELKRRNVFRVGVAYGIVAWLLVEMASVVLPALHLPDWALTLLVVLVVAGFPLALIVAWAFELTPEGIKRETAGDPALSVTQQTGRKLDFAMIGLLAIAVVYFAVDKFVLEQTEVTADAVASEKTIAVLPFVNLSGDPKQEFFSDGISEELLNGLAKVKGLRVTSRTSAFAFKGMNASIPEIAEKLGVKHVLEGSVRMTADRVRITTQLIEVETDSHLWSESYDRKLGDIFAIQTEIATAIANALRVNLSSEEREARRLASVRVVNPEAYRLYLLGRHHLNTWVPAEIDKAIHYFLQAIALDPQYAQAHVGLAKCYGESGYFGYMPPRKSVERERAAVALALDIDSNLAGAHKALATIYHYFDWNWKKAEEEYQQAISLNSNYAEAHQFYTWFLVAMGRTEEAHTPSRRALTLDPLAITAYLTASDVFYFSRQYDRAITQLQEALDLYPNDPLALPRLSWSYVQKGMFKEAIGEIERAATLSPEYTENLWMLGHAYAVAGKTAAARKALDDLHALAEKKYVPPRGFALIHTGLGENDEALEWLERAYQDRDGWMAMLQVHPKLDVLRGDPRFQDLLRRMNFPGN